MTIEKIGAATFETPDVSKLADYYTALLGLKEIARTADGVVLACPMDHRSVVIQAGDVARCSRISLEVSNVEALTALQARLSGLGIAAELASDPLPGVSRRLTLQGPGEFLIDVELTGAASQGERPAGTIGPRKLGHIAFKVDEPKKAADFFVDALGFRVSDWIGDFFAFLRCGPDHHTVNFLRNPRHGMHHIAFELQDMNHIQTACDILGRTGTKLIWGPGRHGPGHNIFTYHHNPDGQIIELFTQLDTMSDEASGVFDPRPWHHDTPQKPKVWTPSPYTSNRWGWMRPAEMDAD